MLGISLSLLATSFIAVRNFGSADSVRGWLDNASIYDGVSGAIGDLDISLESEGQGVSTLPSTEITTQAAQQVLSPNRLEDITNTVLDSAYRWLEGEGDQPDFAIDISALKNEYVVALGEGIEQNYDNLPTCQTSDQIIAVSEDPLRAECRTNGVNISTVTNELEAQLLNDPEFFGDGTLSADDLVVDVDGEEQSLFEIEAVAQAPTAFAWLQRAPLVAATASIFFAGALVLSSKTLRKGIRKLANRLILVVISSVVGIVFLSIGIRGLQEVQEAQGLAGAIAAPLSAELLGAVRYSLTLYTLVLASLAFVLWIASRKHKKHDKDD